MRQKLLEEICSLARIDDRIVLLTADLGFGVLDKFENEFPNRFFNVGVAEQSMIATATGLAEAGFIPYCYSIATFASLRALEFIRNGPVAHQLPVRIIGVGPGMDYGFDGLSHFAVDDISALRSQPGLTIWAPADDLEISLEIAQINEIKGPVYLRIPRNGSNCKAKRLRGDIPLGSKISILSLGDAHTLGQTIFSEVALFTPEVSHAVVTRLDENCHELISQHLSGSETCVVVENHYVTGGLSSLVSEAVALNGLKVKVLPVGISTLPIGKLGSQSYLAERFMTDLQSIYSEIKIRLKS